jgi:hypothetical protein
MKRLASTWSWSQKAPRGTARSGPRSRRPAVEHVGIDLHKKESQICILTQTGEILELRIASRRERFAEVFGGRPRARAQTRARLDSSELAAELGPSPCRRLTRCPRESRKPRTDRADVRELESTHQVCAAYGASASTASCSGYPPSPSALPSLASGGLACTSPATRARADRDAVCRTDTRAWTRP